jgi:hypothetical protein
MGTEEKGAISVVPSTDATRAAFAAAAEERLYWEKHADFYLQRYPDQWIAVNPVDGDILVVSRDLDSLYDKLGSYGFRPTDVWVEYFATEPQWLIL